MVSRGLILPAVLLVGASTAEASLSPAPITVCVDYGCDITRQAPLSGTEWQSVSSLFSAAASAVDERIAIARAIGRMESLVGPYAGTTGDAPRNSSLYGGMGQLDCVAESTNTHTYLERLQAEGLLQHHRTMPREGRHRWLFGTHWTAVVEATATGEHFAVDSWYGANGDPARVQPLTAWHDGRQPDHAD